MFLLCACPISLAPFLVILTHIHDRWRVYARLAVSGNRRRVFRGDLGAGGALRKAFRGQEMSILYLLGGLISLGLLVYLLLALMKPEWFE
jgi:K+-transporting ATPase KdpF subunit